MAKTILTVDDSPSMRMLLRHTLVQQGHQVHEAVDGIAALEWLAVNEQPDLMITDINMPRMDGFGLVEAVRAQRGRGEMPILVLTTESSDAKKTRAREVGATGWIVKPFDPDKLASAIRRVTV
ncbi:MAG: response regulator [Sphingomonas sp.]|nr:response regulator [Sphingomonas sp.]